ncbi:DUF6526 family protein [Pseudalkalibacillus salsuginis]|uniref:DUF6526 family protein n=1 Tax=Pseudalkalibacillus salsuginis TaxID=2910972 RepID=UPI001F174AEC|nr:DUF6526 family protein [Pseudalkalibacillus salsuginis]MCF6411423.1 DUF6526 family protein [Pseudalkalibacillus salsuginis]
MEEQNYQNHRRIDPLFHKGIALLALVTLILALIFLFQSIGGKMLLSLINVSAVLTIILMAMKLRLYALKLQDRIIRDEENFRYYRLTGNLLDTKISHNQVIALRFASDEEYPDLVEKARSENLSPDEIKKAVKNWRPDLHRV